MRARGSTRAKTREASANTLAATPRIGVSGGAAGTDREESLAFLVIPPGSAIQSAGGANYRRTEWRFLGKKRETGANAPRLPLGSGGAPFRGRRSAEGLSKRWVPGLPRPPGRTAAAGAFSPGRLAPRFGLAFFGFSLLAVRAIDPSSAPLPGLCHRLSSSACPPDLAAAPTRRAAGLASSSTPFTSAAGV